MDSKDATLQAQLGLCLAWAEMGAMMPSITSSEVRGNDRLMPCALVFCVRSRTSE